MMQPYRTFERDRLKCVGCGHEYKVCLQFSHVPCKHERPHIFRLPALTNVPNLVHIAAKAKHIRVIYAS